jgi:hypothetical protein
MKMFSGPHSCIAASFARSPDDVGFGYNRNRPSTAARVALSTAGAGGYGFSFVLSLISPRTFGCSPGTYACSAATIASALTNGNFGANRASLLTFLGGDTYLALNDRTAGWNATTDAVIKFAFTGVANNFSIV